MERIEKAQYILLLSLSLINSIEYTKFIANLKFLFIIIAILIKMYKVYFSPKNSKLIDY